MEIQRISEEEITQIALTHLESIEGYLQASKKEQEIMLVTYRLGFLQHATLIREQDIFETRTRIDKLL